MSSAPALGSGTERFAFIHGLRGVAAILVVWSHLSGFWLLTTGRTSALQDAWHRFAVAPLHLYQNGGHLGVVLFFLISGYIITHTSMRESVADFAVKRTMRIFPPLLVALAVCAGMLGVASATDTTLFGVNSGGWQQWLAAPFLLDGFVGDIRVLDVTWTLVIELLFYALTAALIVHTRTKPLKSTWLMTLGWVAISIFTTTVGVPGVNDALPVYVGLLVLGRFIYLGQRGVIALADAAIGSAVALTLFLVFMETGEPGYLVAPGGWRGIEPLVTYAFAVLIFLACMRWAPRRLVAPFAFLGDISYSLYLLHLPIGITVLNLLAKTAVPESLGVIVAVAAALACAWVSYRWVERPSQRLARALRRSSTHEGKAAA